MIRVEKDPDFLNRIANQSAVKPWVDFRDEDTPMDFTPACERYSLTGLVVVSNGEDAFACFDMTGVNEFQGHTFFGETCRGRKAIETAKEMIAWMFARGAKRIWGATAMTNTKARWFNRQVGFKSIGYDDYEKEGRVELFEVTA